SPINLSTIFNMLQAPFKSAFIVLLRILSLNIPLLTRLPLKSLVESFSLFKANFLISKASALVINYCLENSIGNIVIGKNEQWKTEIDIGKRNNQNFVSIPFNKFIEMIQYKAETYDIKVNIIEESYTSKSSFLDFDDIPTF